MTTANKEITNLPDVNRKKRLIWYFIAIIVFLALAGLFYAGNINLGISFVRVWTLRLLALAVLCFALGMAFTKDLLRVVLFSLAAVFLALTFGEAYMAKRTASVVQSVNPMTQFPEFADEFRQHQALHALSAKNVIAENNNEQSGAGELVRDLDEAKAVFDSLDIPYSQNIVTAAYASQNDRVLGYRPAPREVEILAVRSTPLSVVYAVTYTMLPSGWRVTPQQAHATNAIVFMGGSFTFGEGLNDAQSFPYKVGQMLGDDYQVFNFGFSGYGTHQMLAMVENGYLDAIAQKYDQLHVFYLTIPAHRSRAAGKTSWDLDGPMYIVDKSGNVEYKGSFRNNPELLQQKQGSLLWGRFTEDNYQKNLQLALIKKTADLLKAKYSVDLTVIEVFHSEDYLEKLKAENISLINILDNPKPEHLIPGDGHPSDTATTVFAEEIVQFIHKHYLD